MRAVVQRVSSATVTVNDEIVGQIRTGFLVLLGIAVDDTERDVDYIVQKTAGLRVFDDSDGNFNLSLKDTGGNVLIVSQFTLFGDARKGRRPSFIYAARPEKAIPLYESAVSKLRALGLRVETGLIGEHMDFALVNDGPVTILLDSKKLF